jgi:dTDP-glucose pyrophosphorylase
MQTAVILAAGRGSRIRRVEDSAQLTARQAEVAESGCKALIPVGRPFIDYVLSGLADAGYERVCLVIGPHHNALRAHVCLYQSGRLDVHFAVQQDPMGTANALIAAVEFAGDEPFTLINSDNYYPTSPLVRLRLAQEPAVVAFRPAGLRRGNISDERLKNFAVVSLNRDGTLRHLIEKPSESFVAEAKDQLLISMNCWRFRPIIFEACRAISRSRRGEFELTDAVSYAIEVLGERFNVLVEDKPVLDLTTQTDVVEVSRRLASIKVQI